MIVTVAKFGGTSVKDTTAINRLYNIIHNKNAKTIVVVSACAGITDSLLKVIQELRSAKLKRALAILNDIFKHHFELAESLKLGDDTVSFIEEQKKELVQLVKALDVLGEISPKSSDMILSSGEILSSKIISNFFIRQNQNAVHVDSREFIKTDNQFTEASVDFKATNKRITRVLTPLLKKYNIIVCGGFIASDKNSNTTTLGRGGSDYSAAIIASGLKANSLEIWTDVSGIMTSDPRLIKNARVIKELTYDEASELAYFGAKVLHPKTIQPAVMNEIPVSVLNSYLPEHPGTKIVSKSKNREIIKAIAFRKNIIVINITSNRMLGAHGFLGKVFEVFKKHETSVDIVTTSEVSISLTIDDNKNLKQLLNELIKFADVEIKKNYGIICAVGEGIRDTAGIAARFFKVLKGVNILMVSIGASEVNISIVVQDADLERSVNLLHKEFFKNNIDNFIFY